MLRNRLMRLLFQSRQPAGTHALPEKCRDCSGNCPLIDGCS